MGSRFPVPVLAHANTAKAVSVLLLQTARGGVLVRSAKHALVVYAQISTDENPAYALFASNA